MKRQSVLPVNKKSKKTLTDEQINELAKCLENKIINVYDRCRLMFKIDADDSVFERLLIVAKLFKCVECNVWQNTESLIVGTDMCEECNAEICDDEDIDD